MTAPLGVCELSNEPGRHRSRIITQIWVKCTMRVKVAICDEKDIRRDGQFPGFGKCTLGWGCNHCCDDGLTGSQGSILTERTIWTDPITSDGDNIELVGQANPNGNIDRIIWPKICHRRCVRDGLSHFYLALI